MVKQQGKSKIKAMTLVETMVALTVTVMLLGILSTCLIEIQSLSHTSDAMTMLQHEARMAILRISADLRKAAVGKVTLKPPNYDELQYTKPKFANGTPDVSNYILNWNPSAYRIRIDPNGKDGLISEQTGVDTILARHAKDILFYDRTLDPSLYPGEIRIDLNLTYTDAKKRVYNLTTTSIVNLRN